VRNIQVENDTIFHQQIGILFDELHGKPALIEAAKYELIHGKDDIHPTFLPLFFLFTL
jgi:hypothetical protein